MSERALCLVGMSGVGKSHLSRALAGELGFRRHDCDGAVAARLTDLVTPSPGEEPVHALGRWMGMPWSEGYAERERRYLALEEEVTRAALEGAGPRDVIDTTGSVIYLSEALRGALRERARVVYLRTPEAEHARMLELYLREPKPVVWGGLWSEKAGGEGESALGRVYPLLLRERDARYLALAHRWIWASELRGLGAEDCLARLVDQNR